MAHLLETDSDEGGGVTRRDFVLGAATLTTCSNALAQTAVPKDSASAANLLNLSAAAAVAAMRDGSLTAERYAEALLEQCERGKALNAFITLDREQVLAAARAADQRRKSGGKLGTLHGLPIPVKDSVNTKDLRTTAGTPALREFQPRDDAPVVRLLRDQGAIVLGKTNLHELSLGWTSDNHAFGAVHNPYDQARIPGGSSGGTAAAIASRMAPLGVAEDTEGSIRVPAALCGLAGFRPTTSRYPSSGVAPITALFDQVGPHARAVADLALFDAAATNNFAAIRARALKEVKLGVPRGYWYTGLDTEVERITNAALRKLQDAGVELVEAEVSDDLANLVQRTTGPVQIHDINYTFPKYLQDSGAKVTYEQVIAMASPDIKMFFERTRKGTPGFVADDVYVAARDTYLPQLRKKFRDYFARTGVAAIVFPATRIPATTIGQTEVTLDGKTVSFSAAISRNIAPGSTAGLPGLVLPAGLTQNGLPVCLEFDGPSGSDRALLALGLSVEGVLGHLPPPKL
jgi:Asp-tRNA(Asn)/Glu-tRNA(Gln) amidotransferase A subunit family amidase